MAAFSLLAHSDWSVNPRKRFVALARRRTGRYCCGAARQAPPAGEFFRWLRSRQPEGPILAGFDFPIGLPAGFGIRSFREFLASLDDGDPFFRPAAKPAEISRSRPFYPASPGRKGEHKREFLPQGLGCEPMRRCDREAKAESMFWLIGPKTAGRAAITGWRDLLIPSLELLFLWPFDGSLEEGCRSGRIVVVESYPALACRQLGWRVANKRSAEARRSACAGREPAAATCSLKHQMTNGFGVSPEGEDQFDSVAGLINMVRLLEPGAGFREPGATSEGWIFGLP